MKKSHILLVLFVLVVASLAASNMLVHETVEVSQSLSVSSVGNFSAISTSNLEVMVEVDRLDLATSGWSYGNVVFSNDPRHPLDSRVLVAKDNDGYLIADGVVFPTHRVTFSSFDNSIFTSIVKLDGVTIVAVDAEAIEETGSSYGSVVFSTDPWYSQGSRVLVSENNSGSLTLVHSEYISTILAFIKTGVEVAELVYGDLVIPLGQ